MARRSWIAQFALIGQRGRQVLGAKPTRIGEREVVDACRRLLRQRGEASSLTLAAEILSYATEASPQQRDSFALALCSDFGPDPEVISLAAERWLAVPTAEGLEALSRAVESPRQELFRRLNMVPGGTGALVELRADVLRFMRNRPELATVDADLRHLCASWFNRGFLRLEEISWETSADILERISGYEAVHEMRGWRDLRGRLAADRRCFAFFHPALPREPLIFVEVALTHELTSSVEPLIRLDRDVIDPHRANTAMFYSISNAQPGLRGISFGSFLIKQVMGQLARDLPDVTTYATISPLRQFAPCLRDTSRSDGFTAERIGRLLGRDAPDVLRWLNSDQAPPESLDAEMQLLGLAYLTKVKSGIWAADPVAHFHLSNGARVERLNAQSETGEHVAASFGMMVNYLYDAARLEVNHESYVEQGRIEVTPTLDSAVARVNAAWDG